MNLRLFFTFLLALILTKCSTDTINVRNEKQGRLKATFKLEITDVKKFLLDNETAPKPQYTQLFEIPGGVRYFTFINRYNNSIYFYDYSTCTFIKKVLINKKGPDAILIMTGYFIQSIDSIYLYDKALTQIALTNDNGKVLKRISLRGKTADKNWFIDYPQYVPQTVTPFVKINDELLFPGQHMGTIPKAMIEKFKFTARINLKSHQVNFSYLYPKELYGSNYNWEGRLFTEVFEDFNPENNKLIFSFPVSHDLYIADFKNEEFTKVYAGSNIAGTIHSMSSDPKQTTDKMTLTHFIQQDTYAAVKYDRYRNIYYRVLLNAIPDATVQTSWREKPVTIIVMDKDFKYLGESTIGKGDKEWCWQNFFVTREGLNIEYIEKDSEDYLTLKIFTLKNI